MKLSIITVTLNSGPALSRTISNVASIALKHNVEHIIIDGGSTDGTLELLRNSNTTWLSEPDSGIFNAMNKGITLATGQVLLMLNSGDTIIESEIHQVFTFYDKYLFTNILHCSVTRVHPIWNYEYTRHYPKFNLLKHHIWFNHQGTFIPKEFHAKYGVYLEHYKYAADTELLLRWANQNVPIMYSHTAIVKMLTGGLSDTHIDAVTLELQQIHSMYYKHFTASYLKPSLISYIQNYLKNYKLYCFLLARYKALKTKPSLPSIKDL
jgi:glycosyltransferase involved in cell wall biosynthesis